ncbi:MAG TPA: UPF0158 family protein [Candidatus Binataceae bacterium]|jgi:hypothetical protein|nr:UPF0158 family protein [Candidatus Binataceae bacterium]
MRNDQNDARELAFRLLTRIVAEYIETGRRPRGAGLKTELQRRTGGFSEALLGYESFGTFLEAAAQSGFVRLQRIPGEDIEVSLPGSAQNVSQPSVPSLMPNTGRSTYIRRDFWKCFLDWTPGWPRLYDPRNDKAFMFPENPSPFDNAEHARLRAAWQGMPQSFIEIPLISMEKQLVWMQEFASNLDEPSRSVLLKVLDTARPFGAFTQVVRETPRLTRDWSNFRVERVTQLIAQWLNEHGLKVSMEAPPLPPLVSSPTERAIHRQSRAVDEIRTNQIASNEITEQIVRTRLHQVIDRMSLPDLLRLSVPVQYLILER